MAATLHMPPTTSKRQAHMTTAKTNPWLDTVLSKTEPSTPSEPKRSPEKNGPSGHLRPKSSTPNQKTEKKPAQDSLDEAFQAAIKAIVPERLEATRRAKARMELIQGTTQDDPKVAEFTQVTSTTPVPATQKLAKQKEKPLLQAAIEHLTLDRLHTVLYKALDESPKARSVFERELLAPLSPDHDDDEEAIAAKKKSGRKRPRFEVCRWCKEEFDVTDNPEDACTLHQGCRHNESCWRIVSTCTRSLWDVCFDETPSRMSRRVGCIRSANLWCSGIQPPILHIANYAFASGHHHTGKLKPVKRTRRDHDIAKNRQIDTDENRENNVEGFVWDCCWADGDGDGCRTTAHEIDHDHDQKKSKGS